MFNGQIKNNGMHLTLDKEKDFVHLGNQSVGEGKSSTQSIACNSALRKCEGSGIYLMLVAIVD